MEPREPEAKGWVAENPPHGWQSLNGVWGTAGDDVWAVGARGTVLRFNGSRWAPVEAGVATDLNAISGSGTDDVWAVGQRGTALHWDGKAWGATRPNDELSLDRIFVPARGEAWAMSSGAGALLRWQGKGWARVDPGIVPLHVWSTGPGDVWVFGKAGELARFDGSRWRRGPDLFSTPARAISGLSARNVVVGGPLGKILRFDGTRWWKESFKSECPCDADLDAVWVAGAQEAWAFGADNRIRRWDGETWRGQATPDGMSQVRSVWGRTRDDAWAVDGRGSIFHYDGAAWTNTTPSGAIVNHVYSVATIAGELWVAGTEVMRLTRGSWEAVASPKREVFRSIAGSSANDVTALTLKEGFSSDPSNSVVWHFDGQTWTKDPHGPHGARVLWQKSAGELWAAGDGGGVWRRIRGKWTTLDPPDVTLAPRAYAIVSDSTGGAWVMGTSLLKRCKPEGCTSYKSPLFSDTFPLVGAVALSSKRAFVVMGPGQVGPEVDSYRDGNDGPDPALAEWNGVTWTAIEAGPLPWMGGVAATGPDDIWGLGDDGILIHFNGRKWERTHLVEMEPTHIVATDGVVRVIGEGGRVFKRSK